MTFEETQDKNLQENIALRFKGELPIHENIPDAARWTEADPRWWDKKPDWDDEAKAIRKGFYPLEADE